MRKTSKPSTTLKQDLENKDAFAYHGGKGNGWKDSGTEVSNTKCSQHQGISSISSEDTF